MSFISKVTFALSFVVSGGIIYYVHYKQVADREKMHRGVIRDQALLEMKRRQNIQELNDQILLKRALTELEGTHQQT